MSTGAGPSSAGRVWQLAATDVRRSPATRTFMGATWDESDEFVAILLFIGYVLVLGASLFVLAGRM